MIRNLLMRKVPGLPSIGHVILATVYVAINIVITFTNMDNSSLSLHNNLASRTGW
jgi:hypothetical protein